MKWFIDGLKNYFNFKGRASRKAYWMFVLFNIIFAWVAIAIDNMFGTMSMSYNIWGVEYGAFYNFYSLLIMLPSLAILVRRLHDIGKKGTWFFIVLIPIIGWIWMLVLLIRESDLFVNEFGPIPQYDFDKSDNKNDNDPGNLKMIEKEEKVKKDKDKAAVDFR